MPCSKSERAAFAHKERGAQLRAERETHTHTHRLSVNAKTRRRESLILPIYLSILF